MSKKRQHYIPQMILRNFTYFRVPMAIPRICYFDTFTKQTKLVTPKDICCKNNLYELKNDSDEFIYENLIENNLSLLEKEWSLIINKLKNKEMISDRDCALLYVLIIIQLLRTPEVISYNKQIIDKFGHNLTNAQSERYARMASLLFGKINPSVNWIFQSVSEEFFSKHFAVLVSRTPFILSCQRPVLCSIFSQDLINIYFPIASNLCLSLSDFSYNNGELYVEICDNFTDWLNYHIFNVEGRFICSSMPVTELDFYKYCNDLNQ